MFMAFEIESELFSESNLEKVVIKRLFRQTDKKSGLLKAISGQIPGQLIWDPIKESPPSFDLVNHKIDPPLFRPP